MKKMKKLLALMMSLCMLAGGMSLTVLAEGETLSAEVYVTIANKGTLELVQEKVTVTDIDEDGALTINDAFLVVHEAKYEGGAAGYAVSGGWITNFWGEGDAVGYYLNDAMVSDDPFVFTTIDNNDYINAFVYTDTSAWSDTYCYFDTKEVSTDAGQNITLTLKGFINFSLTATPISEAMITVDGAETGVTTDAEGKATIQIAEGGNHVISAKSATQILVPPVCKASVTGQPVTPQPPVTPEVAETGSPKTGDAFPVSLLVLFMGSALAGMMILGRKRKVSYEK